MNGGKWTTKALAHLEMARPYTMFHSGLVAIAGIEVASGGHVAAWRTTLAALVTMCGWEAGLYAGDYYDRELDARSKPARPVPSGRVSAREAFLTMVGLIGAIPDVDGDRAAGCQTVPVVYGVVRAVEIVSGLALCWAILGCMLMRRLHPAPLALVLFAGALLIAIAVYVPLWIGRRAVSRRWALNAHKYLVVERLVLMSAVIAADAPAPAALGLFAATLVASVWSQVLLRERYEQQPSAVSHQPSGGVGSVRGHTA